MKTLITTLSLILAVQMMTACSSAPMFRADFEKAMLTPENRDVYTMTRSKWSDKNMRVMVEPSTSCGDDSNALEVQALLTQQNRWTVLARGVGFSAVSHEQDLMHIIHKDRFENKEKYAHWGKFKGAGSVVIPYCNFNGCGRSDLADITLTMIDSSTGEVIVAVRGDSKCSTGRVMNWEPLVEELADKYPRKFEEDKRYRNILDYEEESKTNALKKKFD